MIPLYFDPGTGALIVQFLAAAVAGILLFYRTVLHKIKSIFGIKNKEEDDFMDETDNSEDTK
ncbi:hypothetical protein C3L50_00825 [Flavobacterium alvei]|uniref:Uncharacterized protein n=1 Tax=Flavobacterium alvei TaxID=2080416 RepID=A0A2S5AEV0_9FLAO|nr:hypothetical protein [Flavobacterium alvei]POY41104.1 hypothetical protein C3L50_00825 [Flavobacterium alvei]HQE34032.1 hypothetical protein [Flavobacterium alvei]HQK38814.1 hypothetical protein [Flavobacterium alvei]